VRVDAELVRRLLDSQHPGYAGEDVVLVDEGWDNFTFRVGSEHAVRLPRHSAAVPLILNEQRWLPLVDSWLDLAVPAPVAIGEGGDLFPWPWSVVQWIPGTTAECTVFSPDQAEVVATSLRALHRLAPLDAPANLFRGVRLQARRDVVQERIERLALPELVVPFRRALEAPPSEEVVWLHGDLHPRNVIVRERAVIGLIDWGDIAAGDAATDLACGWMLFDSEGRDAFIAAYDPSPAELARAVGWAVNFGSAMLDSEEPRHVAIGRTIIEQLGV